MSGRVAIQRDLSASAPRRPHSVERSALIARKCLRGLFSRFEFPSAAIACFSANVTLRGLRAKFVIEGDKPILWRSTLGVLV
jgi:hypothetical protein